jgi:hypothetical protein
MNDPHVSVLVYRVRHDETVSYNKASPLECETAIFKVSVKSCEARFEMKEHFPTVEQAREVVEPFIDQWEFAAALDRDPGEFELVFLDAVVEERNPPPGVVLAPQSGALILLGESASLVVGRSTYPEPPTGVAMNTDVEVMALRHSRYKEGKDTLAGMAYFCLTVLEQAAGDRLAMPKKFGIAVTVADTLGHLSSEKGGAEARKEEGRSHEFTANERSWIEQATKRMIRRAAEVAYDSAAAASQITMADLPSGQKSYDRPRGRKRRAP